MFWLAATLTSAPKHVITRLVCNDSLHSDNYVSHLFIVCLVCGEKFA